MPKIKVQGLSIHYEVKGKGTPILFIHPPLLSSKNFTYQMKELSNQFCVITFDIRGHGKSDPSPKPLTYFKIVRDILAVLDHLEIEKVMLCGYSLGASIALHFMLEAPERSLGAVLLGGISEMKNGRLKQMTLLGERMAKMGAIQTLSYSISWSNANNLSMFWNLLQDTKQANAQNVAQYYHEGLIFNCTPLLPKITQPILLLYGTEDKTYHPYGEILHSKLPNASLSFISQVKHQLPTKTHQKVNQQIRQFVEKL
ncbi:alpha/beta fold hydrolase [Risungbinella massiliensis]|uniref:alpha/beta fold hydrolase n=1 Tax=Risungbinella massiliensis TaxID=1329796 RepID=UPI0005CC709A|nr:alpha/beta hydrolase [Risungbinella massiliensis]